ncbi:MAG: hypothetical protein ACR2QM_09030 [Longimicrobiales bacterium]
MTVRRRWWVQAWTMVAAGLLSVAVTPSHAVGQGPPEVVAERFFHHLGRLEWQELSGVLHPAVLADFDLIAHQLVASSRGDAVLAELYDVPLSTLEGWSDAVTFARSMAGLTQYARGLMESQVMTDVELLGKVNEGDRVSHVLYREVTDHMGVQTDGVSVLSLELAPEGWRVTANAELEVLKTAFRGIPIAREPPPDP